MSDAAEVLDAIYQEASAGAAAQGRPADVQRLFGLGVQEEVSCGTCGRTTQRSSYMQYAFNTQVGGWARVGGWVGC